MSNSDPLQSITILDGKVHIFKRDGSPFFWCGFHFKGKYIRSSTKKTTLDAAAAIAQDWYFKKQTEIAAGQIYSPQHNFGKLVDKAVESYKITLVDRGLRSKKTYDSFVGILNSRVKDFFERVPVQTIDNTMWHRYKQAMIAKYPNIKRGTLHQYKNAIRVVLNYAFQQGILKQLPEFRDEYATQRNVAARAWFSEEEYFELHRAIADHAEYLSTRDKRQHQHALELYDYVIFGVNTGMRVGELNACRFCDVRITTERTTGKRILVISNIKGKRGIGNCQSFYGAVATFERIVERRGLTMEQALNSIEKLFLIHHSTMFNNILKAKNLKYTNTNPPIKRDFVSLRATYICFRLLNEVPIYEIANNCRTSVAMIEDHYAKRLGGQLMPNINRVAVEREGWDF